MMGWETIDQGVSAQDMMAKCSSHQALKVDPPGNAPRGLYDFASGLFLCVAISAVEVAVAVDPEGDSAHLLGGELRLVMPFR